MLKGLIIFGTGIYTGIYLAQNYKVPQVDKPEELIGKLKEMLAEFNQQYRKSSKDDK